MRETTSPESLEKINHSVSSLKAFLNGNYTLLYILSVSNLINNKNMRKWDVFFWFYWSCMRNMFGLSFYKMILQACSKAHCSHSFGVRSRIMQSRNKTTTFLKPLMKIIFFKLLLCPNSLHYCTKQGRALARFRLNQPKPYQLNIYLLYTMPFLINFLIKNVMKTSVLRKEDL